ncbi:PorV/PorQ family protein [Rhodocaloribacter litoris]|nr:PorV/PorQ family protein [Rhodocaloribacter litoris]
MCTKMKALLGVVALLLPCAGTGMAQKVGSTSMQFLKVLPSARAAALGEAYSVWAAGAEAVFWNPAGLARSQRHEVSLTYTDWLFDARQGAFSYAHHLGSLGAVGFQVQYVDFGVFEETTNERPHISNPDQPGMTGRTFRPFSYVVGLTYARHLTDRFALGFGAKYAHESLFDGGAVRAQIRQNVFDEVDTRASAVLFDFGIRYETGFRSVQIASAVQNFGPDVRYAVESYPVPLLFRVGIAADLVGPDGLLAGGREDSQIRAAFDLFHPNDYAQQMHFGMEYEFMHLLSLRAGYKFFYDADGLTLGAGLRYALGAAGVAIDYSYGSMGDYLSGVQRFSLMIVIP